MRWQIVVIIAAFLLLTSCGGECKTSADCTAKPAYAYTAQCIDKTCIYNPIPNVCGNGICEAGENKCTCQQDCGPCAGQVQGSKYLVQSCVGTECLADVNPNQVKPQYSAEEVRSQADTFRIESQYNTPFNMKKDTFNVKLSLIQQGTTISDEKIESLELTGITSTKEKVLLGRKTLNRQIWQGQPVETDLILDMPTARLEDTLSVLTLTIKYSYTAGTASRESTFEVRYKQPFAYVNPDAVYPCPENCDDGNPATRDYCGPETNYFCMHEPIPGTCGNHICETGENKCTCPQDCGPCTGSAGTYTDYACKNEVCTGTLKPGITVEPSSIFDERKVGPVQLNNIYEFNNPFDINNDQIRLTFAVYSITGAQDFKIETVRILERNQLIAEEDVNKKVQEGKDLKLDIVLPDQQEVEKERSLTLGVWYQYKQGDTTRRGDYSKPLGRIALIKTQ